MARKNQVENLYLESARKLRRSLPRFVIFLGTTFLIWIFGANLLIPLGQNIFVGGIESSKIINLVVLAALIAIVITSFTEIREVADAFAGFVTFYVGNQTRKIEPSRLEKLKTTFRSFAYVILVSILFLLFKPLLADIHSTLPGIIVIIIAIWAIVALYGIVMAMSGEIEEAASAFAERLEKRARRK